MERVSIQQRWEWLLIRPPPTMVFSIFLARSHRLGAPYSGALPAECQPIGMKLLALSLMRLLVSFKWTIRGNSPQQAGCASHKILSSSFVCSQITSQIGRSSIPRTKRTKKTGTMIHRLERTSFRKTTFLGSCLWDRSYLGRQILIWTQSRGLDLLMRSNSKRSSLSLKILLPFMMQMCKNSKTSSSRHRP